MRSMNQASATRKSQKTPLAVRRLVIMAATLGLVSCTQSGTPSGGVSAGSPQSLYAGKPHNFRLSLTDAPNEEIRSVFVNVKHAELRVAGKGKEARVIVAENLGMVDLLTLQNGVTLPMADINLPESLTVTQIRLVLDSENNHLIKADGSRCDLKTPSQQKTGIKFLIHGGVLIEEGYSYSIVADFDAKKSVVLQGNGGCLLKPVLKLKSASKVVLPDPEATPGPTPEPTPEPMPEPTPQPTPNPDDSEDLSGDLGQQPGGSTQVGDSSGWDDETETTMPPVIIEEDLSSYFEL